MANPLIVDLSHWNAEDLPDLTKDNVAGVVHKATQGLTYVDPNYTSRATATKAAGLLWGAYHFGDGMEGTLQADHFLSVVQPDAKTLIALDLESNPDGPSMGLTQAEAFVSRVFQVTKRLPVLYTGTWYLQEIMPIDYNRILKACPLWIASYEDPPLLPIQWTAWVIQQFTNGVDGPQPHHLTGITADLDLDQFNGDMNALALWWGK